MTSAWLIKTSSRATTLIGTVAIRTVLPCPLCQVLGLTLYLLYLLSLTSILLRRGYVPSCTWRHWRPEAEHFRNHITHVMARSGQGLRLTPQLTFCLSRPVVLNLGWFLTLPPLQGPRGHVWRVFGCQTGVWRLEDRNGANTRQHSGQATAKSDTASDISKGWGREARCRPSALTESISLHQLISMEAKKQSKVRVWLID